MDRISAGYQMSEKLTNKPYVIQNEIKNKNTGMFYLFFMGRPQDQFKEIIPQRYCGNDLNEN